VSKETPATKDGKTTQPGNRRRKAMKKASKKTPPANKHTLRTWQYPDATRDKCLDREKDDQQAPQLKRPRKQVRKLREKTEKLILRGFRLAYEEHHGKSS
jgi:hypothetical protein